MNNISRRGFFKILTLTAGATLLSEASEGKPLKSSQVTLLPKSTKQHRVVVVGGGIGGLTVAQSIKAYDSE